MHVGFVSFLSKFMTNYWVFLGESCCNFGASDSRLIDLDGCFQDAPNKALSNVCDEQLCVVQHKKEIRKLRYKTFRLEAPLLQIMSLACLGQIR